MKLTDVKCKSGLRAAAAVLLLAAMPTTAQDFSIDHYVTAGGGELFSSGGDFQLSGTIGQFDATEARALSGGEWTLTGGFWGFSLEELADFLFIDRFEATDN